MLFPIMEYQPIILLHIIYHKSYSMNKPIIIGISSEISNKKYEMEEIKWAKLQ